MNEKTAWEIFTKKGLVSDYLKYRNVSQKVKSGEKDESVSRRPDNKSE